MSSRLLSLTDDSAGGVGGGSGRGEWTFAGCVPVFVRPRFLRPKTQYNVRFFDSLLSCHEVSTRNRFRSPVTEKRLQSLPPTCATIEISGDSLEGLPAVWKTLQRYNPVEFRLITANPQIVDQFLDFWEANWQTSLRCLTLFSVIEPSPKARRLMATLTRLHLRAPGNGQVILDLMSEPNQLVKLRMHGLLDVPSLSRAISGENCKIQWLSLTGTACLSDALCVLHACKTLKTFEVDGIDTRHVDQIASLVESDLFPEITHMIVQRVTFDHMTPSYEVLRQKVRQKRNSLILISSGIYM